MKIYRIISDMPDGRFMVYIGSTSGELRERLIQHQAGYRRYLNGKYCYLTSFKLLKRPWYEIALCEDLGDCSKSYMLDKEAYYINYYKGLTDEYEVINKFNPNGLDKNKYNHYQKQYQKQYRQTNKYKQYYKQYYQNKKCGSTK